LGFRVFWAGDSVTFAAFFSNGRALFAAADLFGDGLGFATVFVREVLTLAE
jgi:hypothetical protein